MANTPKPSDKSPNEVLPLCGVVKSVFVLMKQSFALNTLKILFTHPALYNFKN